MKGSTFCCEMRASLGKAEVKSLLSIAHPPHQGWREAGGGKVGHYLPARVKTLSNRSHHLVLNWHILTQQNKTVTQATPPAAVTAALSSPGKSVAFIWWYQDFLLFCTCAALIQPHSYTQLLSYKLPQGGENRRGTQCTLRHQSKLRYAGHSILPAKEPVNTEHRDKFTFLALPSLSCWAEERRRKCILFHASGMGK